VKPLFSPLSAIDGESGLDMAQYLTLDTLASFAALTFLEIVLSVDNILFVAIAADRLPADRRALGRQLGLWLALALRVALLVAVVWLTRLDIVVLRAFGRTLTIKDAVLIAGGVFLLYKGSTEIHDDLEPAPAGARAQDRAGLVAVVAQIGLINVVFSLDSVITAVGLATQLPVMVAAVAVATVLMMIAAKPVGDLIASRPTAKMLGLAFILLVGVALIADGLGFHVPRGFLYFAIGFSLFVEFLNSMRARRG
jgi:predicted tellurium resistance membrane protein TerC